jgi:hypothetical protein
MVVDWRRRRGIGDMICGLREVAAMDADDVAVPRVASPW